MYAVDNQLAQRGKELNLNAILKYKFKIGELQFINSVVYCDKRAPSERNLRAKMAKFNFPD